MPLYNDSDKPWTDYLIRSVCGKIVTLNKHFDNLSLLLTFFVYNWITPSRIKINTTINKYNSAYWTSASLKKNVYWTEHFVRFGLFSPVFLKVKPFWVGIARRKGLVQIVQLFFPPQKNWTFCSLNYIYSTNVSSITPSVILRYIYINHTQHRSLKYPYVSFVCTHEEFL